MTGSRNVNQGGVTFELRPTVQDKTCLWMARMRDHSGMGPTAEEAADALVAETKRCYDKAVSARNSLRPHPVANVRSAAGGAAGGGR